VQIGANNWIWVSPFTNNTFDVVTKVKAFGFDVIEIGMDNVDTVDWVEFKKLCDDLGLEISLCGAFGETRDISHEDEEIRKNGKKYIIDCIKIAEKIGCHIFSGPVYASVGKSRMVPDEQRKREWEWSVRNLMEIDAVASQCGVNIGVEPLNRFESDMINLTDQALKLIRDVGGKSFKIHIDTFHGNIEEKSIPDAIRKAGKDLLGHVHVCENDRGAPGTGHIDWYGIRDALKEIDYDGYVVIESFVPYAKEIAKAASIWRPLADSQDALASEGLKFLNSLFK
jgi:D-psicose/D-tagatose/L-ribulose 3-epimerase